MKQIFIFLLSGLITFSQIHSQDLDNIGLETKTDKSSAWHNYTPSYDKHFEHLRSKPIKFLEIGFYQGASARMWDKYFSSSSQLMFIDIDSNCYNYAHGLSDRCSLHLVDQASRPALEQFVAKVGGDFDIIIDDGGHTMEQQITSFKVLFPHLKANGIYVIEDLHTSYWKNFGSAGSQENPKSNRHSAINFLQRLINDLNYIGARTQCADKSKCPPAMFEKLNYYQKNIEAMFFYDSLCFIIKR